MLDPTLILCLLDKKARNTVSSDEAMNRTDDVLRYDVGSDVIDKWQMVSEIKNVTMFQA